MSTLEMRLRRLEQQHGGGGDGHSYAVNIGAGPPCYWIDDVEVSEEEYRRRCPPWRGEFYVDIGDDEDDDSPDLTPAA